MTSLLSEIRLAARSLGRSPGLSLVVLLVMTIGVGAATALFSLVEACLWKSMTYPVVDRWDAVRGRLPASNANVFLFSTAELSDFARLTEVFEHVGAVNSIPVALTDGEFPERIGCARLTANVIPMLGIPPALGRAFRADEDTPGAPPVAVLSYELWQSRYSGSRDILGQPIRLSGVEHTVIGVMPPHYELWGAGVWVPLRLDPADRDRANRRLWVVATRKPGVTQQQANARLTALAKSFERDYGRTNPEYRGLELKVWNVYEAVIGGIRPALLVLLGAVALLLLVSCANVANLLLVRASARQREIGIRMALGASRWRIARQMLAESLLLSGAGGLAGLLLAVCCLPLLVRLIPVPWLTTEPELIRVDPAAALVAMSLTLGTGLLFGFAPAWQASRTRWTEGLKTGRRTAGDRGGQAARSTLVVAEVALTMVVLAAAGLMIVSYRRLEGVDLGFRPDHLASFEINLPEPRYPRGEQAQVFYDTLLKNLATVPGVDGAAAVSGRPMADRTVDLSAQDFTIEGRPPVERAPNANFRLVSPDYFRVMGVPVRSGRTFGDGDALDSPRVIVINETMARTFWPEGSAIGQRIHLGAQYQIRNARENTGPDTATVVGIVADVKQIRVIDAPVRPEFYVPLSQRPGQIRLMAIMVRSSRELTELAAPLRRAVASVDPGQPIHDLQGMDRIVADAFGPKRLTMFLLAFFASVTITLSALGLYALIAYAVAQRTHEIGVRMTVGATPRDIRTLVLGQGARLTGCGIVFGLAAALGATRLMASLLYGVSPTDPLLMAGVTVVLSAVGLLAADVPSRRAARIQPMDALRTE